MRATRPGALNLRATSNAAMAAPIAPAPTMITSKSRACGTHCKATPRANFGTRAPPPAPVLNRDSAAFAGGNKSNARRPTLRSRRTVLIGIGKQPHQTVGECNDAAAIGRAPGIVFRQQAGHSGIEGGLMAALGNEFGQARDIAQP